MIVSEQLNYIKTRRFHAIFMSVIIEFSRCIGTYSSAKFEMIILLLLLLAGKLRTKSRFLRSMLLLKKNMLTVNRKGN